MRVLEVEIMNEGIHAITAIRFSQGSDQLIETEATSTE